MSKVDQVFGTLAQRLVSAWTMKDVVFVRNGEGVYDASTGMIAPSETRIPVDAVITKLDPKEYNGIYQAQDVKIIPDPTSLGDEPIRQSDWFEYPENGRTIRAKVIDAKQYRGDSPVGFIVIARPQ